MSRELVFRESGSEKTYRSNCSKLRARKSFQRVEVKIVNTCVYDTDCYLSDNAIVSLSNHATKDWEESRRLTSTIEATKTCRPEMFSVKSMMIECLCC